MLSGRYEPLGLEQRENRRIGIGVQRRCIRQVVSVPRSISGVEIDAHMRVVAVHQANERASLGRIQLHVIAVEIIALGVGALSHAADWAVLPRPVVHVEPLVAVRVVDRVDQQHQRIK